MRPFIKGQKNDYNDAEAIAEAALRPTCARCGRRPRPSSTCRPATASARAWSPAAPPVNQIRAFLIEQSLAVRSGIRALKSSIFEILRNREAELSPRMVQLITSLCEDWLWLDERIEQVTGEIEKIAATKPNCRLLMSVPGVGPIISTAMAATIGDSEAFERERDFGA